MLRDSWKQMGLAALIAGGMALPPAFAEDPQGSPPPRRLSRLFRSGGNAPESPANAARPSSPDLLGPPADVGAPPSLGQGTNPATAGSRLIPQPRVNRPATESDPILTRVAIGRSDNGSQFGMFLQVFADGTVLDGEGTHHVGREALRPLVEAIQSTDAYRLKGHCGGPPTDFTEAVHVVVYDRSLGKLRANSFSYSGNPQGCDPGIKTLQAAIDAFQSKLAGPPPAAASTATAPASAGGETISLSPTP